MAENEILVVQSKVKDYIRAKSGMNTSGGVAVQLSDAIRKMLDRSIANAQADGRKTVMDRDLPPVV